MKKNDQILVVAAHPDDEILGCGGTISRHIDQNDEVSILFLKRLLRASRNFHSESHLSSVHFQV